MSDHPLLVIIGASGVGKSTIAQELQRLDALRIVPTWTTRPPRNREEASLKQHIFVTEDEFDKLSAKNHFLEVVQPFNLPYRYGCAPISQEHTVPTILLRAFLLDLLKKHYSNIVVYQIEANYDIAGQRLRAREHGALGTRLQQFTKEQAAGRQIANRVFLNNKTDNIHKVVSEIKNALKKDFAIHSEDGILKQNKGLHV